MKILIYSLVLIVSIFFGILLKNDSGFLHLEYQSWSLEMPLWLAILVIAATFFLLELTIDFIVTIIKIPKNVQRWLHCRAENVANKKLQIAFVKFFEKNWQAAYKYSTAAVNNTKNPIFASLIAAKASNELRLFEKRDKCLLNLQKLMKKNEAEVKFIKANFNLEAGNLKSAMLDLENLAKNSNLSKGALENLYKVYKVTKKWDELRSLLPTLKKKKILNKTDYFSLEKLVYQEILKQNIFTKEKEEVLKFWKKLSRDLKNDIELLKVYIKFLYDSKDFLLCNKEIRNYLKVKLDNDLLFLFSEKVDNDKEIEDKITFLEKLLKNNADNPYLLLSLGKICRNAKLWGKAKDYLEASMVFKKMPETYLELAFIANNLNDKPLADKYYKEGFLLLANEKNIVETYEKLRILR